MIELLVKNNQSDLTPLEISGEWVKNFVNDLGGDFSITKNGSVVITLQNKSSCPGFCVGKQTQITCNEIERTMNDTVKYFDSHFTAGFTECAHETGDRCILKISFNP